MEIMPLESMNKEELNAELKKLKAKLEDLEDMFHFAMAHTPTHKSPGMVEEHEEEMQEIRERIKKITKLIERG